MSSPALESRFVAFAIAVSRTAQSMPDDVAGRTLARQLARAGTAPAANYAEARESLSARDYVFKMQSCLKELRETMVWLRVAHGNGFRNADYAELQRECSELTAITVTCVKKAKARL